MRPYILDNIAFIKKCGVPSARRIKESDLSIVHSESDRRISIRSVRDLVSYRFRVLTHALGRTIDPVAMENLNTSISKLTTFAEERAEALKEKLQPAAARPTRNVIIQAE